MEKITVIKALVKTLEKIDEAPLNGNRRILIAASLELLKELAYIYKCPQFNLKDEVDLAFLYRAVSQSDPDAVLEEDEKLIVQHLQEAKAQNSTRTMH